ncbi:MAG: PP2C family protein-serine/threonine phosphatase, partial [Planctomycetota bacterium]
LTGGATAATAAFELNGTDATNTLGCLVDAVAVDFTALGGGLDGTVFVDFAAGDFHYVATKEIGNSGLRLLVHQPLDSLMRVSNESTRFGMLVASFAAIGMLASGTGSLLFLLRRYDSVHEALNRQMKANLDIARDMQQAIFPPAAQSIGPFRIVGASNPAEETGGDTFDVVRLDEQGRVVGPDDDAASGVALLADATGHGIGPAIAVTQLHAMLRMSLSLHNEAADADSQSIGAQLGRIVDHINRRLHEQLPTGKFVTAWFGHLDASTGCATVLSAGQGPVFVYRAATRELVDEPTDIVPLAVLDDLSDIAPEGVVGRTVQLEPGDMIVVPSDGLLEAPDGNGEQFGDDRLRSTITDAAEGGADAVLKALQSRVDAWLAGRDSPDDRTVLVIERQA